MRAIVFVGLMMIQTSIQAQEIQIVDNRNAPVSYAHIVINKTQGFISDVEGFWNVPETIRATDTIIVSCMGYKPNTCYGVDIPKKERIILEVKEYQLSEVVVSAQELEKKRLTLGNKRHNSLLAYDHGSEVVTFIKTPHPNSSLISVSFFIKKAGLPKTPFRLTLYYVDSLSGTPSNALVDTNIIVKAKKGGSWTQYTFQKPIKLPSNGFFVGMEWLPDAQRHTGKKIQGTMVVSNRQILGGEYFYKIKEPSKVFYRWFPIRTWQQQPHILPAIQAEVEYYEDF